MTKDRFKRSIGRKALIESMGGICAMCGCDEKIRRLELDHIKPLYFGGKDTVFNMQVLCKRCHWNKTRLDPLIYPQLKKKKGFNKCACHNTLDTMKKWRYKDLDKMTPEKKRQFNRDFVLTHDVYPIYLFD